MKSKSTQCLEAKTFLKRALFIAKTIKNLSRLTTVSPATLTRIAGGNYKGTYATRMRIESFIEQYENKMGRPLKGNRA